MRTSRYCSICLVRAKISSFASIFSTAPAIFEPVSVECKTCSNSLAGIQTNTTDPKVCWNLQQKVSPTGSHVSGSRDQAGDSGISKEVPSGDGELRKLKQSMKVTCEEESGLSELFELSQCLHWKHESHEMLVRTNRMTKTVSDRCPSEMIYSRSP